jgi:2-hydroxy-3-keto-5-methylthiopentenyl-1-phosphate phosphatase
MPFAFLCDFDGTISPEDIGARFVRAFSTAGEDEWRRLQEQWAEGVLGHRELTRAECRMVRAGREEALEFTRRFALDPDFAPFVAEVRGRGDHVVVLSEGFDFYIEDRLAAAGIADVPWAANRLRFEAGGVTPEFPHEAGCGRCGNCKGEHARRLRARGYRIVVVGDGLSDRCAARAADHVFARGSLAEWCAREGIAAGGFESFADVAAWARSQPRDAEVA